MIGVPAIAHIPSMTTFIPYELMFNHAGKLRHMTGGQAAFPMVLWADMAGRIPFQGGQHADAGLESSYARLTGLKVVIPSNPYDAKGLMISAIRDVDPVIFCHYSMPASGPPVPDEPYTVPIGEAVVRNEGKRHHARGLRAADGGDRQGRRAAQAGRDQRRVHRPAHAGAVGGRDADDPQVGAEDGPAADLRRRLLQFLELHGDRRPGGRGPAGHEDQASGVPRRPRPGAPEMLSYMRVDAAKIAAAAKKLVGAQVQSSPIR